MPYVSESLVILQQDKLVALVYPDNDDAFAHGLKHADIERAMEENRIELNKQLPAYSQITRCKLYPEEFEKTAKKSIKKILISGYKRIVFLSLLLFHQHKTVRNSLSGRTRSIIREAFIRN